METVIGVLLVLCMLIIAHFTQVTAQQLRTLNRKIDEFMQSGRK